MSNPLSFLGQLLLSRIRVTACHFSTVRAPFEIKSVVVPTPRLILIRSGRVRYTVEKRTILLGKGAMIYIPERTRRSWTVPRGSAASLSWIEYRSDATGLLAGNFLLSRDCDLDTESAAFARVLRLYLSKQQRHGLQAEGEVKAILARFMSSARITVPAKARTGGHGARSIEEAAAWLSGNFSDPAAIDGLSERVGLSPNHFRLLFREIVGMSAQAHLLNLRMHAARLWLQQSTLTIKEIALKAGYTDALYFSRQYRRFWMRPPSTDRVFRP